MTLICLSDKAGWTGFAESSGSQVDWLAGYLERGGRVYPYLRSI